MILKVKNNFNIYAYKASKYIFLFLTSVKFENLKQFFII